MTWARAIVALCTAALAAISACSSDDDSDAVAADTAPPAETAASTGEGATDDKGEVLGSGLLVLNGKEMPFDIDICFEGDDFELNEELRLHLEGRGEDGAGRSYEVQLIRMHTLEDSVIDVIRVRHDDRPAAASHEAQRVHDLTTDEVTDLWGDGTTPLFDLARDGDTLTVVVSAAFGDYPGNGGEPTVIGDGELEATCTAVSG